MSQNILSQETASFGNRMLINNWFCFKGGPLLNMLCLKVKYCITLTLWIFSLSHAISLENNLTLEKASNFLKVIWETVVCGLEVYGWAVAVYKL